jgi:hypothetical protein
MLAGRDLLAHQRRAINASVEPHVILTSRSASIHVML